jgi:hypothetical protein
MGLVPVLLAAVAVFTELPAAEVETTRGERQYGRLTELSDSTLRLRREDGDFDVPLAEVLSVRLTSKPEDEEPALGPRVVLTDGSRLSCSEFSVQDNKAKLKTPQCGEFSVPVARVAQVRFGISTGKLDEAWNAFAAREQKNDLLIVRKEDVLDHLDGVVANVGDKITFLLDNEALPIAREKVYGILYRRKASTLPKSTCKVDLVGGDVLQAVSIGWDGTRFEVRLASGVDLKLSASAPAALDFSGGRLVFLSQLEPREVKYVPYFDDGFSMREYRRDKSLDGLTISVGGKTYSRGVAIYSRTTLRYRIAGDFSRFQAIMGIDDSVRRLGNVRVLISGDSKALFDGVVKGTDAPRPLDLDVRGVRDLEILVDYGAELSIGDHLDLADARLLK